MLKEQLSARARRLWGVGGTGGDAAVPGGLEKAGLEKGRVIYPSGARPRACGWCADKQQRCGAPAAFPPRPASPTARLLCWEQAARRRGHGGHTTPSTGRACSTLGQLAPRCSGRGLASLEVICLYRLTSKCSVPSYSPAVPHLLLWMGFQGTMYAKAPLACGWWVLNLCCCGLGKVCLLGECQTSEVRGGRIKTVLGSAAAEQSQPPAVLFGAACSWLPPCSFKQTPIIALSCGIWLS